jgi:hypothetical protein
MASVKALTKTSGSDLLKAQLGFQVSSDDPEDIFTLQEKVCVCRVAVHPPALAIDCSIARSVMVGLDWIGLDWM